MKVVFFTPSLNIGGIERVFVNYANLLSENGLETQFLTCHEHGILESTLSKNVPLVNLRTNDLKKSIFAIAKFLIREKPDYIVTANLATLSIMLAKCISMSKVKIIASHHNYDNIETSSWKDNKLLWKLYNICFKTIAVSKGIYSYLLSKGVKPNKIVQINNPIDYKSIIERSSSPICTNLSAEDFLLYIGRLSLVKNLSLMIKSFAEVRKFFNVKLVLIGEGPENEALNNLCEQLKIVPDVVFLGAMENPFPYLKRAKLLLLSSSSEAFPTVLLEGLALGKTIVSTPTIGAQEILRNGELGYISPDFSKESFVKTILYGLNNVKDSEAVQRSFLNHYSAKQFLETFKNILD